MSKILIVEDEKNISKLIEDTLHLASYETECCFDGEDALNKIKTNSYDLILIDIKIFIRLFHNNMKFLFL